MTDYPTYLGHKTLIGDAPNGKRVVCLYTTGDRPDLEPAKLLNVPAEFNHAGEGEEPRFQYLEWFICNPHMSRWNQCEMDGIQVLELQMYPAKGMPPEAQLSQAYEIVRSVRADAGFLSFMVSLMHPEQRPFGPLPSDPSDLPEPLTEKEYFNRADPIIQVTGEAALRQLEAETPQLVKKKKRRSKPVLR